MMYHWKNGVIAYSRQGEEKQAGRASILLEERRLKRELCRKHFLNICVILHGIGKTSAFDL